METQRRCDGCAHVDMLRSVHPMRCGHPILAGSLPVGVMRASNGRCGPQAELWEPKEKYRADI